MSSDQSRTTFPCRSVPEDPAVARLVGLYPQRQEGLWVQRVKVLGGLLTAGQWSALGRIARRFTPRSPLHLTTRQDVELHDIAAELVGDVQRALCDAGLTGLGACGDTLRNVTVCPCGSIDGGRIDLVPVAWQIRGTLEAMDGIFAMPRKFKISLSCSRQCGQPWINDLGLVAVKRDGRWGFFVVGAGSLGAEPATGIELFEWLGADDVLPLVVAAVRLFMAHGDREHRTRARLRHVRQRVGDRTFIRMLRDEFENAKARRTWPKVTLSEGNNGFASRVVLTFANGDVSPAAASSLGELAGRDDVRIRIANHHRVVAFGRDRRQLGRIAAAEEGLAEAARPQAAVVACPAKRWCKRALVETNGIADRIRSELGSRLPPQTTVCISGCPNGCSHCGVAEIGLFGRLATRGGQKREVYNLLAGGGMGHNDKLARLVAAGLSADEALAGIRRLLDSAPAANQ